MRFDLHFEIRVIPFNLILVLSIRAIYTIFIPLNYIMYLLAIVKSHTFRQIFATKKLQLFVKYKNM